MKPVYSHVVLATFFLAAFMMGPALASQTTEFWGTVTVDGRPAPTGSVIVAKMNGNDRGEIVTAVPGGYGGIGPNDERLIVTAEPGDLSASETPEIEFYVNGRPAHETGYFLEGAIQGLEITVGGEVTTMNTPMITTPSVPRNTQNPATASDSTDLPKSTARAVSTVRTAVTTNPAKPVATTLQTQSTARLPTRLPTLKSMPTAVSDPLGGVATIPSLPQGKGWVYAAYAGLAVVTVNLVLVIAFWLYRRGERQRP
jgi:hypothetical protein